MATISAYKVTTGRNERERTRYRVRYRTPSGRQTDKRGFRTKAEAERFLNNLEVSKDRGEYVNPTSARLAVGALAENWLRRKEAHLKPSAFQPLESAYRVHVAPVWAERPLNKVTQSEIETWIVDLMEGTTSTGRKPVGATIVIRCHEVLSGLLDEAVKDRRLAVNPARGVQLPRKQHKANVYLSHDQVFSLARESGRADLILTLAYTGIRWGEAAGLQVKHVDLQRRRLRIERNLVELRNGTIDETTPKNGKPRTVPFPQFLEPYLQEATRNKLPNASVFTEPHGGSLRRPNSRSGWFIAALAAADCPHITPHDLRHSAASFAVSSGANVKAVQRMLGHTSASMTLDVYADLFDDDLDNVASALNSLVLSSGNG